MKILDLQNRFKRYFLYEKGNKSESYKSVVRTLNMFITKTAIAEISIIDRATLREYLLDQQEQRQWSPKTYRNHCQNFQSFFKWCKKEGILKKNPIKGIDKPKLPKALPRCLNKEDAQKVIHQTEWYPWRYRFERVRNSCIISVFIMTGIRLQELLNLQVHDVNLEIQEMFIHQGKGNKDRKIPIHPQLVPKLHDYLNARKQPIADNESFFTGIHSNKPLTRKDVHLICKKVSTKSSIYFTPHMLRHTFGRLSVEADLNLYKIKEIMGHEHLSTTQRYISVSSESIKQSFCQVSIL